jgi:hypothetical protein
MMVLRDILRWCTLVGLAGGILSCQLPDRYLIYPKELPVHVQSWTEDVDKGPLRLHLVWAKPVGAGPWPTVLVHPDGSAMAADMRGVLWDLASQGYLAVAADYRRLHDGTYQRTLFPWCEEAEVTTVLEFLRVQPWVDGQRLAFRKAASSAYSSPHRAQQLKLSSPTTRSRTFHDGWRRHVRHS